MTSDPPVSAPISAPRPAPTCANVGDQYAGASVRQGEYDRARLVSSVTRQRGSAVGFTSGAGDGACTMPAPADDRSASSTVHTRIWYPSPRNAVVATRAESVPASTTSTPYTPPGSAVRRTGVTLANSPSPGTMQSCDAPL